MQKFGQYLQNKRIGTEKQRQYYVRWMQSYIEYCNRLHNDAASQAYVDPFIIKLSASCPDWQVEQAKDAIRLYFYYKKESNPVLPRPKTGTDSIWADSIHQMVNAMRLRHLSYRTEQTYLNWMRQFYRYVKGAVPKELGTRHVTDFLTYLAVERKVSASTQNQAFCSILFFSEMCCTRKSAR